VHTFSHQELLYAFFDTEGIQDQMQDIKSHLDSLLKTAEGYLFDYSGGVPWNKEFEQSSVDMLRQSHPWADSTAIDREISLSRRLCWHEGFNKDPMLYQDNPSTVG